MAGVIIVGTGSDIIRIFNRILHSKYCILNYRGALYESFDGVVGIHVECYRQNAYGRNFTVFFLFGDCGGWVLGLWGLGFGVGEYFAGIMGDCILEFAFFRKFAAVSNAASIKQGQTRFSSPNIQSTFSKSSLVGYSRSTQVMTMDRLKGKFRNKAIFCGHCGHEILLCSDHPVHMFVHS